MIASIYAGYSCRDLNITQDESSMNLFVIFVPKFTFQPNQKYVHIPVPWSNWLLHIFSNGWHKNHQLGLRFMTVL